MMNSQITRVMLQSTVPRLRCVGVVGAASTLRARRTSKHTI
jgi:hypothetical protein